MIRRGVFAALLFAAPLFAQPTISSIDPASGPPSGGSYVHITGTDLVGFALLCPSIDCSDYVRFGDALGTIVVDTPTEVVVVSPPHEAGTVDLTVNVAGRGKLTIPAAFRYETPAATDLEKILLPIVLNGAPVPGAFGSMWKAEVTFHNAGTADIPINAPNCNPFVAAPCPPPLDLQPGSTVTPALYAGAGVGVFVGVPRQNIRDIDIALRIQDISRQALTWGTAIPVVRASEFQPSVRLVGVPADPRFRITLRVYQYDSNAVPITLRIFLPSLSLPLVETERQLTNGGTTASPAFLQIDGLAEAYPQLRGLDVVRVEVASAGIPPKPIWAFISVTNNETQHVTVIAPSPTAWP